MLLLAELAGLYLTLQVVSKIILYSYAKASYLRSVLEETYRSDDYVAPKPTRQRLSKRTAGKSSENFGSPSRNSDLRSNRSRASSKQISTEMRRREFRRANTIQVVPLDSADRSDGGDNHQLKFEMMVNTIRQSTRPLSTNQYIWPMFEKIQNLHTLKVSLREVMCGRCCLRDEKSRKRARLI